MERQSSTPRISHVFAGVPVRNLEAALAWYERLLGRPPDSRPMAAEGVWHLTGQSSIYVVADARRAGQALLTIAVDDLESLLAALIGRGVPEGELERIPGPPVRAVITDPDGNRVTFFGDPSA
jgi:glyoxylase I family protein